MVSESADFPADDIQAAWLEGYQAFDASNEHPVAPYEDGSLEAESWLDGWEDRKEDLEQIAQ